MDRFGEKKRFEKELTVILAQFCISHVDSPIIYGFFWNAQTETLWTH